MADEAVIRIVMQDAATQQGKPGAPVPSTFANVPPLPPPQTAQPQQQQQQPQRQIAAAAAGAPSSAMPFALDQVFKIADTLRGTIGGLAGRLVGSALDAVMAFRKMQIDAVNAQLTQIPTATAAPTPPATTAAVKQQTSQAPAPDLARYVQETTAAVREVRDAVKGLTKITAPSKATVAGAQAPAVALPTVPSMPDQGALFDDAHKALKGLGMSAKDSTAVLDSIVASGEKFGNVEDIITAAMKRPKKGVMPDVPLPSLEVPSRLPVAAAGAPKVSEPPVAVAAPEITSVAAGRAPGVPTTSVAAGAPKEPPSTAVAAGVPKGAPVTSIAVGPPPGMPMATAAPAASAGAMGGMAAAAGIAAVAVLAIEAYKALVDSIMAGTRTVVAGISSFVQGLASPSHDPAVPIAAFSGAVGAAADKVAYTVPMLGFLGAAAGEAGKQLAGLMQNLDRTADRYGEYSPDVAVAQALGEVRLTMGDMRRAQQIGPELSRYVDARAALQDKIEDLKTSLLTSIVPLVTSILKMVEKGMPVLELLLSPITVIAQVVGEVLDMLDRWLPDIADNQQDAGDNDPTTAILRGFQQPGGGLGIRVPGV